jgi:hypothetical protein
MLFGFVFDWVAQSLFIASLSLAALTSKISTMVDQLIVCHRVVQDHSFLLKKLPTLKYQRLNEEEIIMSYTKIIQNEANGEFEKGCIASSGRGDCITYCCYVYAYLKLQTEHILQEPSMKFFEGYYSIDDAVEYHVGFCYEHKDENNDVFAYTFWDGSRPTDHKDPIFIRKNQSLFKDNTKCTLLTSISSYFLQQSDHRLLSSHDGPYGQKQLGLYTICNLKSMKKTLLTIISGRFDLLSKVEKKSLSKHQREFIAACEQWVKWCSNETESIILI